jgi:ATP-dependent Lhr-like helicase
MLQILQEDEKYPYLSQNAYQLLEQARCMMRENGMLQSNILPYGMHSFFLCPWVGTKELGTIKALFSYGLKDVLEIRSVVGGGHHLQITTDLSPDAFIERVGIIEIDTSNPDLVLPEKRAPRVDKYDAMVPDELLRKAFLCNELDVPRAIEVLRRLGVE